MKNCVTNNLVLDENQIWVLPDQDKFNYSDGAASERYLKKAFSQVNDLSSTSYELEKWIKDWPSEYHLSRKRTQLLRGFNFDKSSKVLEVGCGCGAITRFLGETFDDVVAIEGSIARAKLARMRTKGLNNVSILCSQFQKIHFKQRFDIIFCIGVFEYSNVFVNAEDPHDHILEYFSNVLTPDGVVIIAIENQFGLKYFSSSREDHTSVMFDGIEGYPRFGNKAKTFGYDEFKERLNKYFNKVEFYFPFPDYKIPSCVLSETFFDKAKVGELVGNFPSRDYTSNQKPLFDEKFALLELDKNNKLPFFSNSFLVIAGKNDIKTIQFNQLGLMYSANRIEKLQTVTRFTEDEIGNIQVKKTPIIQDNKIQSGKLRLHSTKDKWVDGISLHTLLMKRVKEHNITLEELFEPCRVWLNTLKLYSFKEGNGLFISGKYVDCIWKNSYIYNGECHFIDQEWEWHEKINLNIIVIRSIYFFLWEVVIPMLDVNPILKNNSTQSVIKKIASTLEININKGDYSKFCELESEIQSVVHGKNRKIAKFNFKVVLWNQSLFLWLRKIKQNIFWILGKIKK
jgi:SAM-dependent methyltransferase